MKFLFPYVQYILTILLMKTNDCFHFYTRLNQTELLGKKARNLVELLRGIKGILDSSIYHHTHRFIQQYHYMLPQPPNDFAYWITDVLNENALGKKMASVEVIKFQKIKGLRKKFIEILSDSYTLEALRKEITPII